MYAGTPPWEIGRPQPAFEALVRAGRLRGRVLDVGCGTGENALAVAATGAEVLGVDAAEAAIRLALEKARERRSAARFRVHDALELGALGETFDTVIDCGLFHVFTDAGRALYVRSLAAVMAPGADLFVLCFSDEEPGWGGPRRVSPEELGEVFGPPFAVQSVTRTRLEHLLRGGHAKALLAHVVHVGRVTSRGN